MVVHDNVIIPIFQIKSLNIWGFSKSQISYSYLIKLKVVTKKLNHRKCKVLLTLTLTLTRVSFPRPVPLKNHALSSRSTGVASFLPSQPSGYMLPTLAVKKILTKRPKRKPKLEVRTESTLSKKNNWLLPKYIWFYVDSEGTRCKVSFQRIWYSKKKFVEMAEEWLWKKRRRRKTNRSLDVVYSLRQNKETINKRWKRN